MGDEYTIQVDKLTHTFHRIIDALEIERLGDTVESLRIFKEERDNIRHAYKVLKAWGLV